MMQVWGASIDSPTRDRAVAAWLLRTGVVGGADRRFFQSTIRPGDVVVDVGANQGVFTLLFARLVGPRGRVVAVEPEPALFAALERNCRANGAGHVTCVHAAAGELSGRGVLQRSRLNGGDHRMVSVSSSAGVPVDVVTLDDLLPDVSVDLVKIDVQGFEMQVCRGMSALLTRSPSVRVVFEYWPWGLRRAGSRPEALLEFFQSRGFSLFDLRGSGPAPLDLSRLRRRSRALPWSWTNVLAVRPQPHGTISS